MSKISLAGVAHALDRMIDSQMTAQARITAHLVAAAEEAGWSADGINGRLRRIVRSIPIGEIHVVDRDGGVLYTSLQPLPDELPDAGDLGLLLDGTQQAVDQQTAPRLPRRTVCALGATPNLDVAPCQLGARETRAPRVARE